MNKSLKLKNVTIQSKLVLIIVTISTVSLLLAATLFTLVQLREHRLSMIENLTSVASITAKNVQAAVLFKNEDDATKTLSEFNRDSRILIAAIYTPEKALFASYNVTDENIAVLYEFPDEDQSYQFKNDRFHLYQPITIFGNGTENLLGYVYLKTNLESIHQQLIQNILVTTIIVFSVLLITILLTSRLQKIISNPILELSKATQTIKDEKNYGVRVKRDDYLEIQQLCDGFNSMLDELQHQNTDLIQLQNYLSNIIDSMPSVLIGVDAKNNVTQWNSEAERVTGIIDTDAVGKSLRDVFPRLSSELPRIQEAIISREQQVIIKKQHMLDDALLYENITIYPLVANGVNGAVIRLDDITDQVRIEEMMVQNEKILSLGGLAAGMAHEVNNPLAGIMQTANVMTNRLTRNDVEANLEAADKVGTNMETINAYMKERGILRMLESIHISGERVAHIVDNMLTFSRKGDDSFTHHNINELLDKSLELSSTDYDLKKQYDFKAITIVKDYDENLPLVACEEGKIQQVFLNLLRNGAEAMQEAAIEQPTFILRSYHDAEINKVCITIEDNGPGMTEDTRKRIFEPFFTTKPVGVGTGLGLSVSYFIITENHSGEMRVESELGKGTLFKIKLPCEQNHDKN
jgi:PAS domain S-box-containing protein